MLKTPERVPFRLTRHIMLRGNSLCYADKSRSILTTLEVLMHDPLYKWALSPLKALQHQKGDLQNALHLRQNLLRTAMSVLTWKDIRHLDMYEGARILICCVVSLIPNLARTQKFSMRGWLYICLSAAIFALCSGSSLHCDRDFFLDPLPTENELAMAEDLDQAICYELYACAPEVLAKINIGSGFKLSSQIITFDHEGNWGKALEHYDLQATWLHSCAIDLYSQGLTSRKGRFQHDFKFTELQYEKLLGGLETGIFPYFMMVHYVKTDFDNPCHLYESVILQFTAVADHCPLCLRELQEGDAKDFYLKLKDAKQELLFSIYHASEESTECIYTAVVKCSYHGLMLNGAAY
ncbi:hypothetical protein POM88_035809 [Heracleum sosnowskyi]|uniref:Uncharacterized protein n=1 Tax=Heracleum sosnowskyi TaxID=360622 RepID=A0AAD8HP09_9APIA|nr:hypothetical protein POM88_035809 [Heracleum sosnowskyi]